MDGSDRLEYVYFGIERVGCRALASFSFSALVALRRVIIPVLPVDFGIVYGCLARLIQV